MQSPSYIIISSDDDTDSGAREGPSSRRRKASKVLQARGTASTRQPASRQNSSTPTRSRRRRKPIGVTLLPSTPPAVSPRSQNSPTKQIIDLTSLPDEEPTALNLLRQPSKRSRRSVETTLLSDDDTPTKQGVPKCGVCFEQMDENMACGPCGHVFCEPCLRAAIKTQKKCPTCRRNLQARQIHKVYINR